MKKLITTTLWLLLAFPVGNALAQTGTITGTVTDSTSGEALPGVNVVVQELSIGAATDGEGEYTISNVPAGDYTLTASFIGYEEFEQSVSVEAGETIVVDIALEPTVAALEEIVVRGGYTVERAEVSPTGAIGFVSGEEIAQQNIQSLDEGLQGRVAGVRVTSLSGQPGAGIDFQIRGDASILTSSEPLYIVNGVQINAANQVDADYGALNPLAHIDPSDIASIQVLKDAAAAAIYGARAANGVVIITTKQGRPGETRVDFSARLGRVERLEPLDVLSPAQWGRYAAVALMNRYGYATPEEALAEELGLPPAAEIAGPNWYDALNRIGFTQSYDLSVSGGSEVTQFYVSGTYERDKGQVIESNYQQVNLRVDLAHDLSDDFSIDASVNLSTIDRIGTLQGGAYIGGPTFAPLLVPPYRQIYALGEDGTLEGTCPDAGYPTCDYNEFGGIFTVNIIEQVDFSTWFTNSNSLISSVGLTYHLTPNLYLRTFTSVDYQDYREKYYDDPRLPGNAAIGGEGTVITQRVIGLRASQTLNYNYSLGEEHALSGLVGAEIRQNTERGSFATAQGFPSYRFRVLSAAAEPTDASSFELRYRGLSFFGNAEYTYDDTYILSGTVRADGSSRFGEGNRFGLFGAISGAWRIANEGFMDAADFVNLLTLRASYGITGNSDLSDLEYGAFASRPLIDVAGQYLGQSGIRQVTLAVPTLGWQESHAMNIGLDYTFFNGRLSGEFNVFQERVERVLLPRQLPSDTGFESVIQNVGANQIRGLEITVNTVNLEAGKFQWSTNFNITFLETKVLELVGGRQELTITEGRLYPPDVFRVGEPLAQQELVPWAGVHPANGRPMYLDADGHLTYYARESAEQLYDNLKSDFYGGFGNTFSYAGLRLNVFFQFDYGRTAFNNNRYFLEAWVRQLNHSTRVLDYWSEPGEVTYIPKPYWGGTRPGGSSYRAGAYASSRFLEDASYIRLESVRLSYTLPADLTERIGLRSLSIFAQGTNLATWTNYTGLDPEVVGADIGTYPQNQRLSLGINVGI